MFTNTVIPYEKAWNLFPQSISFFIIGKVITSAILVVCMSVSFF